MNEAIFQTKFSRWLKHEGVTGAYELKLTKTDSIPFSAVKDHQIEALRCVANHTFVYKIPDVGINQKPFDAFVLKERLAYVVIMFYKPGVKHFYGILVDDFVKERDSSKRKSLTEERAAIIGWRAELR